MASWGFADLRRKHGKQPDHNFAKDRRHVATSVATLRSKLERPFFVCFCGQFKARFEFNKNEDESSIERADICRGASSKPFESLGTGWVKYA
jgi:hypothetical protein